MICFTSPPDNFRSKMETVGIFCVAQEKLLYLHKQDHKPECNTRTDPSGKVDPGELPHQAMVRELKEETGIQVDTLEFVKTYYVRYPEMDFIYHKYRLVLDEDPIIVLSPNEHKAYAWFTPEEALQQELIPGEDEIIRDIYDIE